MLTDCEKEKRALSRFEKLGFALLYRRQVFAGFLPCLKCKCRNCSEWSVVAFKEIPPQKLLDDDGVKSAPVNAMYGTVVLSAAIAAASPPTATTRLFAAA